MPRRHRAEARGFSLIELMVAMAVLTFGLLALWRLHVFGLASTGAGRRHTVATAIARELAAGLERLPYGDTRLAANVTGVTVPAGGTFGNLVVGTNNIFLPQALLAGAKEWDDARDGPAAANPVPGVRSKADLLRFERGASVGASEGFAGITGDDSVDSFRRRWTVWDVVSPRAPAATPRTKIVAVSVTWQDPPFHLLREVVLYTQVQDPAALQTALGATP